MNLLDETRKCIKDSGHDVRDIIFIGSEDSGHQCTWAKFAKLADREYGSGYGAAQVAEDLIVVFSDGAKMWRGEYDGSEWWNFSSLFKKPSEAKPIGKLFALGVGWEDLAEINKSD